MMDARPQRPLRSMRTTTFHDENAIPEGPLPKTIHQRNKSSPALTNNGGSIGFRAAAKRTAFADVSNIAVNTKVYKDESTTFKKPVIYSNTKLSETVVEKIIEKKPSTFLRPAQRPLSVSSIKNLLSGSSGNTSSVIQQHDQPAEIPLIQQPPNIRQIPAKRATTIFKDAVLDTVQELEQLEPQKLASTNVAVPQLENVSTQISIPQPNSPIYLPAPTTSSRPEPVKTDQLIATSIHQANIDDIIHQTTLPIKESSDPHKSHSDIQEDPLDSQIQPSAYTDLHHDVYDLREYPGTTIRRVDPVTLPPSLPPQPIHPVQQQVMQLPTPIEPEEHWEDEDEESYEDEGFVTARSFRSKGDNTTGGATTVLVPRQNQRARREIEAAKKLVEATRTHEEIEDESFDTSMVAEYGDEIFEYMRQLEVKMSPNPHYMDNQHEIQWSMRSVLMDWLVQVHHRFNLLPETLFLCVNYIDRFLSSKVVSLGKLQLVGATAIFIAAKYEEINCPSVQEIVYMVDGGYSIDEILKAERFMLTMLQFELGWPGPMSFLRRISKADDYDLETRTLAKYFLEVTMMDERFIGSPPSFTAAASHCLARMMLHKGSWSAHHVYYSGYTWTQLRPLVQLLVDCCEDPRKHHSAVYNKYCDKRYKRASAFVETEMQRGFVLPQSPAVKTITHSAAYAYYATPNTYFSA